MRAQNRGEVLRYFYFLEFIMRRHLRRRLLLEAVHHRGGCALNILAKRCIVHGGERHLVERRVHMVQPAVTRSGRHWEGLVPHAQPWMTALF